MKPGFILAEVWNGLRRNLSMAISIVLVTMVSMFLFGLGLLVQTQVDTLKGYWYDRIQVSIYLCPEGSGQPNCEGKGVTDAQKDTIKAQLDQMPEVQAVFYESEQEAFDRFKEQFKNSPVASSVVKVGAIPASYRVQLKDPKKFAVVTSQFEGAPGVASVQDQERVLGKVFTFFNWMTAISLGLAAAMVACAALLMVTTIRQVAYTRRREIGIMRLVGASNFTIRTPFVLETLLSALLGVGLAIGLLFATVRVLGRWLREIFYDKALIGTGDLLLVAPWMVLTVAALAIVTSMITLWRYLRV